MSPLEEKIDYKFRNSLLLAEALTHPSLAYETRRPHFDNQRLEFLGDAVLQLVLTEWLYDLYPSYSEGKLTKVRSRLVSRNGLKRFANNIALGDYLLMGKGEDSSGGRTRASTLADACEALIGAIFLDGGIDAARTFILSYYDKEIETILNASEEANPKGQLQEILQALTPASPSYHILEESGPEHRKEFVIEVRWEGEPLGRGKGHSKKEAEMAAAREALQKKKWRLII